MTRPTRPAPPTLHVAGQHELAAARVDELSASVVSEAVDTANTTARRYRPIP
jgi:hypothetical protein